MVFGSCSSDEAIDPVAPEEQAISFGTFLDKAPQVSQLGSGIKPLGAVLDLPGLKTSGFTVLAYNTEGTAWAAYTKPATPNFMDDQTVLWNTPAWEYTPITYWPRNNDDTWGKVSFFGYSTVNGASADGQAGGNPIIGFTAQSAAAAQVDLVADADIDVTKETAAGKVNFAFDHILSRIGFSAKLAGAYPSATVTVTSLKVYYKNGEVVSKGTYTFSATDNKAAANWSLGSIYFTEVGSGSGDEVTTADVELTTDKQNINAADRYLMLIPQSGIAAGDMYVELKYTVATDNAPLSTVTKTVDVPAAPGSGDAWLPGKAYTYNFTVTLDAVNFNSDIDVDTWDDNDAAPAAALSVSPAALNFAAAGEDKSFTITGNTAWTVTSSETWCTVNTASGNNDATINVTAEANSGAERAATITVSGTGVADQIIGVTQEAGKSGSTSFDKVVFTFPTTTANNITFFAATTGQGTLTTTANSGSFSINSSKYVTTTDWELNKSWNIEIPLSGFTGGALKLSFYAQSSNTGPRDFSVEWSANNSTWSTAASEEKYTLSNSSAGKEITINPTGLSDKLYIRLRVTSTTQASGSGSIGSTGTSRITTSLTVEEGS